MKLYVTLPNGIKLFTTSFTESMTQYAKDKGLKDYRFYLSEDTKGIKEYIMVFGQDVTYTSQLAEAMACHIDMISMAEK